MGRGIGVERVVGDKVGRLILRRGEQKDPRASRPRRRKPGTRKTPPSHVDHPPRLALFLAPSSSFFLLFQLTPSGQRRPSRCFHPPFPRRTIPEHEERNFEGKESALYLISTTRRPLIRRNHLHCVYLYER